MSAQTETLWIDPELAGPLARAGWTGVDAVMRSTLGERFRSVAQRENWRLRLDDAHHHPRQLYVKKHRESGRLWCWSPHWTRPPAPSPGVLEAHNIQRLAAAGVPTMRLVAYGESHSAGGGVSFVATEALEGYTQLDHDLRRRFESRPTCAAPANDALRRLICAVADVARRFHEAGFNHRDLYCCHFFVRAVGESFDVRLIDLQRVEHRRRWRRRWVIKDLAQLAYSVPPERVSPTRQMLFLKRYLGVRRLRDADKRLIRAVLAKRDAMIRHLGPHP